MCCCTVFALFYFLFDGNFQVKAHGALYSEERLKEVFFCYEFEGLIYGGAYFRNFTVPSC